MATQLARISDFPHGWRHNLSVRNIPIVSTNTGHTFWVDSTLGSDGGTGDRDHPFATIDYAIGRCTANNNDRILVAAGHAETISSASAITCDVAGVGIIGIGEGADRPELTFDTSTAASIVISAANVTIANIVGIAGIDSLANPFHVQAANCHLDIEWQDGSSTVEGARVVLTTAAADKLSINLRYIGFPAGNACVNAIRLVGCNDGRIHVDYYGIASTSVVEFLTTACTNILITGYIYNSGTTDGSKLVVDTVTGSTWFANIYDGAAGALFSGGSGAALASDDVTAITNALYGTAGIASFPSGAAAANAVSMAEVLRYIQDQVINGTGTVLDTNTSLYGVLAGATGIPTWPTAAAYANSVSIAEVLAYIQDSVRAPAGAYIPGYGYKITKSHNLATDNVDLFTVTGKVAITLLTGEVTTVVGGAATYAMRVKTTTEAIFAATTIDTDAAGTMYLFGGDPTVVLNNAGTPVTRVGFLDGAGPASPLIVGLTGGSLVIESDLDAADTGVIRWDLWYMPLEASASVVAA